MEKVLQRLKDPKANIELDSLGATRKKYLIGKHQVVMVDMDSFFKKFRSMVDRSTIEMNRCLKEKDIVV